MNDDQISNWAHSTMGQRGTIRATREQLADQNEAMLSELQQLRREKSHRGDVSYLALRDRADRADRDVRDATRELQDHRNLRVRLSNLFRKYKVASASSEAPDQTVETVLRTRDELAGKVPAQAMKIQRLEQQLAERPTYGDRTRRLRERGTVSMGQEYWIWEDNQPNNLDARRTPIIIQPGQLRALLQAEVTQREDAYKQTRKMRDERDEWKAKFTALSSRVRGGADSRRLKETAFATLRQLGVDADEAYNNLGE